MSLVSTFRLIGLGVVSIVLAACGGGGDSGGTTTPPPATTYTIGGTASGLASGSSVVLQNNGGGNLTVSANGNFTFGTTVTTGTAYAVTVLTQPTGQVCTVTSGTGTATGNVGNIGVACAASTVTVGGTVGGLATGASVVLQNNAGSNLTVSANGAFTFATAVNTGAAYAVTVLTQPTNQICSVASGTGMAAANVTSVAVTCVSTFTIGGTVSGLAGGASVVLQDNGAANLTVAANGTFTFATPVASGGTYAVSVLTQPSTPAQVCTVTAGAGTASANVTNVVVTCVTPALPTFTIGGTISGLAGPVTLQNNGVTNLVVSSNGTFSFGTPVTQGGTYAVTVLTQPTSPVQSCVVTNGSGPVGSANITSVVVTCTTTSFTVGGTISGLGTGANVVLRNNGGNNLTVSANGSFTFSSAVSSGGAYLVSVLTNPTSPVQTCAVTGGTASGTVTNANVTSVVVTCTTTTFTVGGTISGLGTGANVVLQNNAGNNLTVSANGSFSFSTAINSGATYTVTVLTQPTSPVQVCVVTSGSGTVASSAVTSVVVTCTTTTFTIGGSISGLGASSTVVLRNNGGDNKSISANGGFTFTTSIASGATYAVTVFTQPSSPGPGQTCTVTGGTGSGTVGSANVTTVAVTCVNTDQTAPTISSSSPRANAVGAKIIGGVVVATFSEALDTTTVTTTTFNLGGPGGTVAGSFSFAVGNTQVTFTPTANLLFDTDYTVTLGTGLKDPSGNGLASATSWRFNTGKKLALGFQHTCARFDDGRIKCWGRNDEGELGYGDTQTRGHNGSFPTSALAYVDLGARTAVSIAAGDYHTCAILDNGDTKCWGLNDEGELGQGGVTNIGDTASNEIANLTPINFGGGHQALEIVGGQGFTCARLDDGTVKCFGKNDQGQLGQGNTTYLGITPGDVAAASPVALGTGLTPVGLSSGHHHTCVVLVGSGNSRHAKCFGRNQWGQLGQGDTANRGDGAGQMGNLLLDVDLGVGAVVQTVLASGGHSCARLADGAAKCWGLNTWGEDGSNLGNGGATPGGSPTACSGGVLYCVGDGPGEMGSSLLTTVASTTNIAIGFRHSCALTTTSVKCWGSNEQGQLGLAAGNTGNGGLDVIIGDAAGEIAVLANTVLTGSAANIEEISGGGFHTCIVYRDGTINCWGLNDGGQLGHDDTNDFGDDNNEMATMPNTDLGV